MNMRCLGISLLFLQMLLFAVNDAELSKIQNREGSSIKVNVALVPVDVSVRDKNGGFVDNLQAKDFVVYDNGVAQKIELFSYDEMPLDVALVVDGAYWDHTFELQKAATTVFQLLNPKQDRVALFCAGLWMVGYSYQLTGFTQDRFLITHQLENILNLIGSSIKDGLWEAALYLRSKKDPHRRRAIILISDNYENFPPLHSYKETLDEILEAGAILYSIQTSPFFDIKEWPPSADMVADSYYASHPYNLDFKRWWDYGGEEAANLKARSEESYAAVPAAKVLSDYNAIKMGIKWIDTFGNSMANPKKVAQMAGETGGEVLNGSTVPDLPNAVSTAIQSLKHSYTLGFYPSDKKTEDTYHALKVKVDSHADYSIRARKGYYAHVPADLTIDRESQALDVHSQKPNSNNQYLSAMAKFNFTSLMPRPLWPKYIRNKDSFTESGDVERYLLHEELDWENGKPSPEAEKYGLKHIGFTAVAKKDAKPEGKPNTIIDLRINAAQLFFDFFDDQYRAFLYVCILQGKKPISKVMTYLVSFPEKTFEQEFQSNITLSVSMKPSKRKDIRIIVFQHDSVIPPYGSYGIQPVQSQP